MSRDPEGSRDPEKGTIRADWSDQRKRPRGGGAGQAFEDGGDWEEHSRQALEEWRESY